MRRLVDGQSARCEKRRLVSALRLFLTLGGAWSPRQRSRSALVPICSGSTRVTRGHQGSTMHFQVSQQRKHHSEKMEGLSDAVRKAKGSQESQSQQCTFCLPCLPGLPCLPCGRAMQQAGTAAKGACEASICHMGHLAFLRSGQR